MYKWALVAVTSAAIAKTAPQTPPPFDADLFSRDKQVVSGHVEFLYWKVEEGALDYAVKMNSPAWSSSTDNYPTGNLERTQYYIDPGFRLGISYFRAPKYWEVWGYYTRFTARGNSNSGRPDESGEYLNGTWPTLLADSNPVAQAKTDIHLNYNVADILVDRFFNPNPHLRMRAVAGITGAWIDQNWSIYYYGADANNSHLRSRWTYGGVGLRLGTMADWYWSWDIYMTARASVAALMGHYRNRVSQTATSAPGVSENVNLPARKQSYTDTRAATTFQFLLGPSYQKSFTSQRLEIFVGYELTVWANLQEVYRSIPNTAVGAKQTMINTGILALQGLTTRLTLDF